MSEPENHGRRASLTGSSVGRYRLEECLGAGATGEVYRATDPQLARTVAIKRLRPDVYGEASPTHGLLREARRASALNHPGIAAVYDVFSEREELYLVMEYVDGPSLRDRLRAAPVDLIAFRTIAGRCAEALDAAHQKGILHGDVKPANIMLTRDGQHVKLCDFGLARRVAGSGATVADSLTTIGPGLAGTPAYMAPEIVYGLPIDERADIFSLGTVFYEMLAGFNPFATGALVETLDRIRNVTPPLLDTIRSDVPPMLASVVTRMLVKDRSRRMASMREVVVELSRVPVDGPTIGTGAGWTVSPRGWGFIGVALLAVALVLALAWPGRMRSAVRPDSRLDAIHLAVLPFAVSGPSDKAVLAQGLVDALIERLARLSVGHPLQVASASDLRGRGVASVKDAREQIGATVALTGTLAYEGSRVHVLARLVDTKSDADVGTRTFDRDASNSQALRDALVDAAVALMGLTLDASERRALIDLDATQPGAYDYYLQARGYLMNYDRLESLDSAVAVFRKALEVDSRYARAYAGLGQAYWRKYELTRVSSWVEPARAACEGALALDAELSESHACLGMVLNGVGEHERAAKEFNRALEREPTNDVLYLGLATAFELMKLPAEAERTYQRAIMLRPHYWAAHNNLAVHYYRRGMYDEALKSFEQVVSLAPDSFRGYSSIGAVHFMRDRTSEAVAALEKSMSIRPNYAAASNLGTLYFYEGQFDRSAEAYRQALALGEQSYQVWSNLAGALEAGGHRDDAEAAHRRVVALAGDGLRVNPRNTALRMTLADSYAALGDRPRSRAALDQVLSAAPTDPHTRFVLAVYFETRLGDRAAALDWLAKSVASGQTWREIDRSPALRALRTDKRFLDLRRAG